METIVNLTKENIQDVVNASMEKVVVLAFWAQQQPESLSVTALLEQMCQGRYILAKVNCETEMEIVSYFRIQSLPTIMVLSKGQPVDGVVGPQDAASLTAMLEKHLPAAWELKLNEARQILAEQPDAQALTNAISLLIEAQQEKPGDDISLALADAYLQNHDLVAAKAQLESVGLAGQDSFYQNLMAKLQLAEEAADTPEIRDLQQKFEAQPENLQVRQALAKALHQARRDEEALELLFEVLQKDLSAGNGEVKQAFLDILTAIGQGNALANQYRRKLYSLLY
ncbi:tetratricopeptide repeat protein [Shewanella submarina]|uniref:Co-chaperone YbbN n=1 Tax=Shewanella submarina TaxID=2016376 RepID=A0ABV7GAQ9_9GAMM|nr:tetratricopeptide repeat protein [Shewanella submarina]MCL1037711.1 tetratricopeptide repeat protein [Shewanella submarina]